MLSARDRTLLNPKIFLIIILLIIFDTFYYTAYKNKLNNSKLKSTLPKEYLVWSSNCHIPSMDPFQTQYMDAYTAQISPICSVKDALLTKLFNATTKQYTLHINEYIRDQYVAKDDNLNCCYQKIIRIDDEHYNLLDCKIFEQDFIVPNDFDYMLINCRGIANTSIVYQDGMSFIQERLNVEQKFQNYNQTQRAFGILLFGIDSVSQFNFRRVMPKTFQYVQHPNWFKLSGYNKMEDNTFPNLMAVLTGLNPEKSYEICKYNLPDGLNNCSTLFKLFNEQGLATAYSEDEAGMSTFNYLKEGFLKAPTDYYQRPLLMAIEDKLPKIELTGLRFCIGPRKYAEYVYDFGVEFAERFLGKSIFGLFWANSFSHNDWLGPTTMDQRMVDYFSEMHLRGILENNVVLLFSDHGSRWGHLRKQKEGYIEERLPMFFLHLPQWFQEKYPQIISAMEVNKNRLTSPYDLHMTLKHLALISMGKEASAEEMDVPLSCPTCQTLFKPVLENRTCEQAGIENHWCTCTPYENILDDYTEEMENLTKLVIDEMNGYLRKNGYDKKCAPLIFDNNKEANLKLELHKDVHTSSMQTYRMNFVTQPNEAEFDATFTYNKIYGNLTIDVPQISRLNSYAKDSPCIKDNIAKKYCICYDSITKD